MGIKGYNNFLKEKINSNCIDKDEVEFNYVYIDCNFFFHFSIYGCDDYKSFIDKLISNIYNVVANLKITDGLFLITDGPGTYAKLTTQIEHRKEIKNISDISCQLILPGTKLMKKIDEDVKNGVNSDFGDEKFKIICSSSEECGEGDLKIFNEIIENNKVKKGTHLIVSTDTDMINGTIATNVSDVYILKDFKNSEIVSIDDIKKKFISNLINHNNCLESSISNEELLYADFSLISTMMGNDYIKKLNYVKIETLYDSYVEYYHLENMTVLKFDGNELIFDMNNLNSLMQVILKNVYSKTNKTAISYDNKKVKCYLDGLLWCVNMYKYGVCPDIKYVYNYKNGVTVFDVLYYFEHCEYENKVIRSNIDYLNSLEFAYIVLDEKYYDELPKIDNFENIKKIKQIVSKL